MECKLCGRHYINLGVHLRHKHAVDPDDYKEQFGIMKTTALVDAELSEHMRASQKRRMKDPEYLAEVQELCRGNAKANKANRPGEMSRAAKEALARRNKEANEAYLRKRAPEVAKMMREKGATIVDVRRELGISSGACQKILMMEGIDYSATYANTEAAKRAAATVMAKTMTRVEKVLPLLQTTKSVAEMLRKSGITKSTYQRWLDRGLIPRHPNGRKV